MQILIYNMQSSYLYVHSYNMQFWFDACCLNRVPHITYYSPIPLTHVTSCAYLVTQDSNIHYKSNILLLLSAIKLIKKYFNKKELLSLMTLNFYSRLYYNSEIWTLNTLHGNCKQLLLSTSARALKCCMYYPDPMLSFEIIHEMNMRATPEKFTLYKHALVLFKLYNDNTVEDKRISLNLQHQFSIRGNVFKVTKKNKLRVGNNIMINRMSLLNNVFSCNYAILKFTCTI